MRMKMKEQQNDEQTVRPSFLITPGLYEEIKHYAIRHKTTVSDIICNHFEDLVSQEKPTRTTICVYPSLYKRFKVYAAEHDTTVTDLFNSFMEDVLSNEDPDGQQ